MILLSKITINVIPNWSLLQMVRCAQSHKVIVSVIDTKNGL